MDVAAAAQLAHDWARSWSFVEVPCPSEKLTSAAADWCCGRASLPSPATSRTAPGRASSTSSDACRWAATPPFAPHRLTSSPSKTPAVRPTPPLSPNAGSASAWLPASPTLPASIDSLLPCQLVNVGPVFFFSLSLFLSSSLCWFLSGKWL